MREYPSQSPDDPFISSDWRQQFFFCHGGVIQPSLSCPFLPDQHHSPYFCCICAQTHHTKDVPNEDRSSQVRGWWGSERRCRAQQQTPYCPAITMDPFTVQSAPDPLHASYFTKCFLPFHAHMRPMKLLKGWLWKVVDSINTGRWFLMSTSKTNLSLNKMYVSKTAFFLPLLKRDLIFRRGKLMSSFTLIALLLEQIGARSHEVAFHADYRLKLSLSVFSFSLPFKNMLPRQQGGGFFLCGKCDLRWLRQN